MKNDNLRIMTYRDIDGKIKEICVTCGAKTQVESWTNVDNRAYYSQGVGQLCDECGKKIDW